MSQKFKINNERQVKKYLGMRIVIDKHANVITVDQEHYIKQLLIMFYMSDYNTEIFIEEVFFL